MSLSKQGTSRNHFHKTGTTDPEKDLRNTDLRKFNIRKRDPWEQCGRLRSRAQEDDDQSNERVNPCMQYDSELLPGQSKVDRTGDQFFTSKEKKEKKEKQIRITDSRLKIHIPPQKLGIFNFEPQDPDEFMKKLDAGKNSKNSNRNSFDIEHKQKIKKSKTNKIQKPRKKQVGHQPGVSKRSRKKDSLVANQQEEEQSRKIQKDKSKEKQIRMEFYFGNRRNQQSENKQSDFCQSRKSYGESGEDRNSSFKTERDLVEEALRTGDEDCK